ncbi:hypothetical protein MRX96_025238 [Rhipicephalus microplus]
MKAAREKKRALRPKEKRSVGPRAAGSELQIKDPLPSLIFHPPTPLVLSPQHQNPPSSASARGEKKKETFLHAIAAAL